MKSKLFWIGGIFVLSLVLGVSGVGASAEKVIICHKPGTPDEATLNIPEAAVPAHLKHGDYLGGCEVEINSVSGEKFEDMDADGRQREEGEGGLGGWRIYVDYDNDAAWDSSEPYGITASDGSYTIMDIDPGTWYLREESQPDWKCSFPNLGVEPAPVISAACEHLITILPSSSLDGINFGNWGNVMLSGYKWIDIVEPYGEWDPANEPPMGGWTVELFKLDNSTVTSIDYDVTDGMGFYEFEILPGGTYVVCERIGFMYHQTFPTASTTPPAGETIFDCSVLGQEYAPYGYQFPSYSGIDYINSNFGNKEFED